MFKGDNMDKIIYDSNEITTIISKINENTSFVENDIKSSINNDFFVLQELDLFNEGLNLLKSYIDKIVNYNSDLVLTLNNHDSNMNEINNKHLSLFNKEDIEKQEEQYGGGQVTIDEIVLNKVTDGKVILTEYINEVLPSFSYDRKLEVLKSIVNNDTNSLNILTNKEESDIVIYKLKEILNKDYSIELSKLSKEEETDLQKSLFESISDNDTNIFDEIENDSFLHGLSYYKQVAQKNGISTADLIFDDKNKDLFMNSINDIYNNDSIDVLTDKEMNSVKEYINQLANKNNINVSDLLNGSKYSSVIKGGIYYED